MEDNSIVVPSDATSEGSGYWYRRGYSDAIAHQCQQVTTIKIETTHDTNGNPRRGWLVYGADGAFLGFADENYRGTGALANVAAVLAGHDVSPHEQGGRTNVHADGSGGYRCSGPNGTFTVRSALCVLSVTPSEYKTALRHGTKRDPWGADSGHRQF